MKSFALMSGVFIVFVVALSESPAGDVQDDGRNQAVVSSETYESHTRVRHRRNRGGGSSGSYASNGSAAVTVEKTRSKSVSYFSNGSRSVTRSRSTLSGSSGN